MWRLLRAIFQRRASHQQCIIPARPSDLCPRGASTRWQCDIFISQVVSGRQVGHPTVPWDRSAGWRLIDSGPLSTRSFFWQLVDRQLVWYRPRTPCVVRVRPLFCVQPCFVQCRDRGRGGNRLLWNEALVCIGQTAQRSRGFREVDIVLYSIHIRCYVMGTNKPFAHSTAPVFLW